MERIDIEIELAGSSNQLIEVPSPDGEYVRAEEAIAEIKLYRDFIAKLGRTLDMIDGAECACYDISKLLNATPCTQNFLKDYLT